MEVLRWHFALWWRVHECTGFRLIQTFQSSHRRIMVRIIRTLDKRHFMVSVVTMHRLNAVA